MSDYTKTTNFTAKDALTTGNAAKVIKGSEHDTEFDNIATAVATKYDSGNLASQAEAQAGTSNTVLMTPLRAEDHITTWAAENDGMVADLQALDLSADAAMCWDQSGSALTGFTLTDGIEFNGTTMRLKSSVAGDLLDISSGVLSLTDVAAGANNPMNLSGTVWTCDITALGAVVGSDLAATDTFLVDYGGVASKIEARDMALRIISAGTTSDTLAIISMNAIRVYTGTATLTLPNSTLTLAAPCIIKNTHASQYVTIALAASATLDSIFHPGPTASVSDRISPGGTGLLYQTATGTWHLSGDLAD